MSATQESRSDPRSRCFGCFEQKEIGRVCRHCGWDHEGGAASVLHLAPGTILNQCYVVGRVLGQGGFGITYIGWDTQLQRKIAVKEYFPQMLASRMRGVASVIPATSSGREDFQYGLRSFMTEGRALASFDHPCIVPVFNLFEVNHTGYLVMPYLEGATWGEYLSRSGGRIAYDAALGIIMRVLDGLREVHAHGMLHRDISPDNIYVTTQGLVKIIDFGAARTAVGERSQSFSVILKEGFAPEEQYRRNGNQGPWTDVYAAAATLYRAITGTTPPPALDRLYEDTLKNPSELGAALPPAAEAALLRGLSLSAGARFQSVETFQRALSGARKVEPDPHHRRPPNVSGKGYGLFDAVSIGLATLFGAPLGGAALVALNYYRLGRKSASAASVAIGLIATGLTMGIAIFSSQGVGFGLLVCFGLSLVSLFPANKFAKQLQGTAVEEHLGRGGKLASRWGAFGIGIASGVIFAVAFAAVLAYEVTVGNTNFEIVNQSSQEIHGIYLRKTGATAWGSDLLGGKTLSAGQRFSVQPVRDGNCLFDLRLVYTGQYEERLAQNVCERGVLIFTGPFATANTPPAAPRRGSPPPPSSLSLSPDFDIVNRSARSIHFIYLRKSGATDWGNDRLNHYDTVSTGQKFRVTPVHDGTCLFDLRVEYNTGQPEERLRQNTCLLHEMVFN